jgi:transketolase
MALAARIQNRACRIMAILSDGECNEGSVWESAMFAPSQDLHKVTAVVDCNGWQATGRSNEVLALQPLGEKWQAFGWRVVEVPGHDIGKLAAAMSLPPDEAGRPTVIIAHTIKGKGVSFMEDDNNWHYRIPNDEELAAALKELGA